MCDPYNDFSREFSSSRSGPLLPDMCGSRNFRYRGGGGCPSQSDKKKMLFFFSQFILQKSNGQFQRNLSFFKVLEGVQHFTGGPTFSRGGGGGGGWGYNCLFPIETL